MSVAPDNFPSPNCSIFSSRLHRPPLPARLPSSRHPGTVTWIRGKGSSHRSLVVVGGRLTTQAMRESGAPGTGGPPAQSGADPHHWRKSKKRDGPPPGPRLAGMRRGRCRAVLAGAPQERPCGTLCTPPLATPQARGDGRPRPPGGVRLTSGDCMCHSKRGGGRGAGGGAALELRQAMPRKAIWKAMWKARRWQAICRTRPKGPWPLDRGPPAQEPRRGRRWRQGACGRCRRTGGGSAGNRRR